jgi:hypothetical protein
MKANWSNSKANWSNTELRHWSNTDQIPYPETGQILAVGFKKKEAPPNNEGDW